MAYKVTKDAPMPSSTTRHGESKYPMATMEVGESFFDPDVTSVGRLRAAAYNAKKNLNRTFTICMQDGGVRCWRVK